MKPVMRGHRTPHLKHLKFQYRPHRVMPFVRRDGRLESEYHAKTRIIHEHVFQVSSVGTAIVAGQTRYRILFHHKLERKAKQDLRLKHWNMSEIDARLGNLWPDKGVVRNEQYQGTKAALREQEELMSHMVHSEEDKVQLEIRWSFND
jgi:hypothetical protein